MNAILIEQKKYTVSAVLWNVFPDLVIRDKAHQNLIGLEVKALHTAAEEKSANFMTPIQLVRKGSDFIVILNWGWQSDGHISYPHIHAFGVFDAWLIGKVRDYGWLFNAGNRVKGIDLATPIINAESTDVHGAFGYKAEEGNMGKLMRISMPDRLPMSVPEYSELKSEYNFYSAFKGKVLALGLRETFNDLCLLDDAVVNATNLPTHYPTACQIISRAVRKNGNDLLLIAGARPEIWARGVDAGQMRNGARALWLSSKLAWTVFGKDSDAWYSLASGAKPDSEFDSILAALGAGTPQ
jgi:hypothetical protein